MLPEEDKAGDYYKKNNSHLQLLLLLGTAPLIGQDPLNLRITMSTTSIIMVLEEAPVRTDSNIFIRLSWY
jgi:hypothetical protein